MIDDRHIILKSKLGAASPQEAAELFVEYVNTGLSTDDMRTEPSRLLDMMGPVAIGSLIWILHRIQPGSVRSKACQHIAERLRDYDSPPIGPMEMLRLMVSTRRSDVVKYAFEKWAEMAFSDRANLMVGVDPSTVQMLATAAAAKNRTSSVAAAAALFVCPGAEQYAEIAAKRLGRELNGRTTSLPAKAAYLSKTLVGKNSRMRDGIVHIDMESVATCAMGPDPYIFYDCPGDSAGLLRTVTTTVMTALLKRNLPIEKARLMLEEFPKSWVVAAIVAASFYSEPDHWPTAVGAKASYAALSAFANMACDVTAQNDTAFPWRSVEDFEDLMSYLLMASESMIGDPDDEELNGALKESLSELRQNGCFAGLEIDLPASAQMLVELRASMKNGAIQPADALPALSVLGSWYNDSKSTLQASERRALLRSLGSATAHDRAKWPQSARRGTRLAENVMYAIGAELSEGLGLSPDDIMDHVCIGVAISAMPRYGVPTQFGAEVVQAIEQRVNERYPGTPTATVLKLLRDAPDKTCMLGEFFDSHRSLFVH